MQRPAVVRQRAFLLRAGSILIASAVLLASCSDASSPPPTLTITPGSVELEVGASRQFTVQGASGPSSWSSDNEGIATVVPQTGFVTAVARGSTQIHAANSGATASAQVTVLAPPLIALSTPLLEFETVVGGASPQPKNFTVTNMGDGALSGVTPGAIEWGPGQPQDWLSVSASGSTAPLTVTVTPVTAGLAAGTYTASIPIGASVANSPQRVAVTLVVRRPAIIVPSRSTVALTLMAGQTATEAVSIANGGDVPLTGLAVALTGAAPWLTPSVNPTSAPATVSLNINSAGLAVGTHNATVRITSGAGGVAPVDVAVNLTVTPGPTIGFNQSGPVQFSTSIGANPPPAQVTVLNEGNGTLQGLSAQVQHQPGQNWLAAQLSTTTAPASLQLSVNSAALPVGNYTASVVVTAPGASNSPRTLTVQLAVGAAPNMVVAPTSLNFSLAPGGTSAQNVAVTSSGAPLQGLNREITYTGGGAQGWLTAGFSSTTSPSTLTVSANAAGLANGTYTANVRVTSSTPGVAAQNVPVTLVVAQTPSIGFSVPGITVTAGVGSNAPATTATIVNTGGGVLTNLSVQGITYTSAQTGWLQAQLAGPTTAPATLNLGFTTQNLPLGTYTAQVRVASPDANNSPQSLNVTVNVTQSTVLSASTPNVLFGSVGVGAQDVRNVTISSTGGTATGLAVTSLRSSGWLAATLGASTPTTLEVSVNATGLNAGTYMDTLRITSTTAGVQPLLIPVTMLVVQPSIQLSPSPVQVSAFQGTNAASATVNVTNGGSGTLSGLSVGAVSYSAGASGWLTRTLSGNTAPATISLTFSTAGLAPGSYTATIPVMSTVASPVNLVVNLTVTQPPAIGLTPAGPFTFATWSNATQNLPGAQVVQITNTGGGTLTGLSRTIAYGAGASNWLNASFNTTTAPATLTIVPNTVALAAGTYTATITIMAPGAANRTITVNYDVLSFSATLNSTFVSQCQGCHATGSGGMFVSSSQTPFQNWQQLRPRALDGRLTCRIFGGCSHLLKLTSSTWTTFQNQVNDWIAKGAPF